MYRTISIVTGFAAALVSVAAPHAAVSAAADTSTPEVIAYSIHETPDDPSTPVVLTLTLSITASETSGNSVGWDVTSIEFRQPGTGGGADTVWIESAPSVPTSDGLWWIDHADANDPQEEEFVLPPHLTGTATAQDPNDDDLDYDFEGMAYAEPTSPEEPPYEITAAMDYIFLPPIVLPPPVDREPVEVLPWGNPGGGGT